MNLSSLRFINVCSSTLGLLTHCPSYPHALASAAQALPEVATAPVLVLVGSMKCSSLPSKTLAVTKPALHIPCAS